MKQKKEWKHVGNVIPPICPYCQTMARLADSKEVYGRSYGRIYLCSNYPECDSYVGIHRGTKQAKGTMANAELRKIRIRVHHKFDRLWQSGEMKRAEAYGHLASLMGIPKGETHIAMFDLDQCRKALEVL